MSIDFIPVSFYTPLYYHLLLLVVLLTLFHTHNTRIGSANNIAYYRFTGTMVVLFVLFYLGLRPVSAVFFDMRTYYYIFMRYSWGGAIYADKDILFHQFTYFCAQVMNAATYFFVCAAIYVIPTYAACRKWFDLHWFYPFLAIIGSLTFWNYGSNGIRNGMASSIFIFALSRNVKMWQFFWLFISVSLHKAMAVPALAYIITFVYNKPRFFLYFWLLCIPLSLALPNFWTSFFAGLLGEGEDRVEYLVGEVEGVALKRGFRWDFLLYGAAGVFAGWYYIFRKKFNEVFYKRLYVTFLIANSFWILVIRANFSNRFAYLSWFLLALVIFYPMLKALMFKQQHERIGLVLLAYFGFTYLMEVILK